jgi:hypothetical protein
VPEPTRLENYRETLGSLLDDAKSSLSWQQWHTLLACLRMRLASEEAQDAAEDDAA